MTKMKFKEGMKCPVCEKGRLHNLKKDFDMSMGCHIKDVPRYECDVCYEAFFDEETAKEIDNAFISLRDSFRQRFRMISGFLPDWGDRREKAETVQEKEFYNVWDNYREDVEPVLNASRNGKWTWFRNQDCKYIDVRIDMRTGHCIIRNRHGDRINPEDLAYQYGEKNGRK